MIDAAKVRVEGASQTSPGGPEAQPQPFSKLLPTLRAVRSLLWAEFAVAVIISGLLVGVPIAVFESAAFLSCAPACGWTAGPYFLSVVAITVSPTVAIFLASYFPEFGRLRAERSGLDSLASCGGAVQRAWLRAHLSEW